MLFLLTGAALLYFFEKGDLVILLNQNSTDFADVFFQWFTHLGRAEFFVLPLIWALFVRYEMAIAGLLTLIFSGLLSFLFKQVLFKGMFRPTRYFTQGELTHFIEGFDYHAYNSFPSGHTMTAFALFFFITLLVNKKWVGVLALGFALLVGVSRMYLLQHFFVDVYVGSVLGLVSCLLGYHVGVKVLGKRYSGLKGALGKRK